ncbi:MAG: hypothetical protein KatS3mg105_2437 [Gemmatales bacterium]|nr:MAG: hypothetical protein KatS3mg105_2437 [Gemmatales bacterium]
MTRLGRRRLHLLVVWSAVILPFLAMGADAPKFKLDHFEGKVVPIKDIVSKFHTKLDKDAWPTWLALVTTDGKVLPLIKNDNSRMFFKEPKLQNRLMRIEGRLLPGSQLLQVIRVYSIRDGKLYEVFYWCDVCVIKRFEKQNCDCCGEPMILREEPIGTAPR